MRRIILAILVAVLIIILLLLRGCPGCSRLFEDRGHTTLGYPSNTTLIRSDITRNYDIECLSNLCTADCVGNSTRMNNCTKECRDVEHLESNSQRYPQCKTGNESTDTSAIATPNSSAQ